MSAGPDEIVPADEFDAARRRARLVAWGCLVPLAGMLFCVGFVAGLVLRVVRGG